MCTETAEAAEATNATDATYAKRACDGCGQDWPARKLRGNFNGIRAQRLCPECIAISAMKQSLSTDEDGTVRE